MEINSQELLANNKLKLASGNTPDRFKKSVYFATSNIPQEVSDMWPAIRSNMSSLYNNMEIKKKSLEDQYRLYSNRISQTPTQERVLNNIGRQQTLKADLYLTLLQKREENYIQLYSTASKARLIDEPMVMGKVSPKNKMIWVAAFGFGFVFPIGLLMCLSLLRFRIFMVA